MISGFDRRGMLAATLALPFLGGPALAQVSDVTRMGARGDGLALDHRAINAAIAAASKAGGGTVYLPAGRYLCFTIQLMSNVTLVLGPGAILEAADPAKHRGRYDSPEANGDDLFQDFGHSHWHNSLIYGDGVQNVAILGPGLIDGAGLTRNGPGARWTKGVGERPLSMRSMAPRQVEQLETAIGRMDGLGNKAIALKNARNVLLRDFSVLRGGHFAVLATGVDTLTIDNLRIDTNRDGLDIDACRNVRISNCTVNSPNDDAIVLKASMALGVKRPTENVTITNCIVSGFDIGTMIDGSYGRTQQLAPDRDGMTGRIKLGTEGTGGFRNIAISNCVFERSRGLAIESVDGAALEDVIVSNLTMRELTSAPIFLRLGDRRRAPEGTGVASLRRVSISNVNASGVDPRFAASITGLVDSPVEDVSLTDIRMVYAGGGTAADAARAIPEERASYPDPSMFGTSPAYGLFVRHARRLHIDGLQMSTVAADARPPIVMDDVSDGFITRLDANGRPAVRNSRNILINDRSIAP